MLYMVEMDMPHADRLAAWNAWYEGHIEHLLAMPGFLSAQRFCAVAPDASPYLAIYEIERASVLTGRAYTSRAGPKSASDWAPFMSNWRRNLFAGAKRMKEVSIDEHLVLWDRTSAAAPRLETGYVALRPAGLDESVFQRGMCVLPKAQIPPAGCGPDWVIRTFCPLSSMRRPARTSGRSTHLSA